MSRSGALAAVCAASFSIAAGCGYPSFQFGNGGFGGATSSSTSSSATTVSAGGAGGMATTSTSSATSSTTSTSSTSSTTSSAGTGGGPCMIDHLVISEIRTRGTDGGDDEFVELYNPTPAPVVLDGLWTLSGRKAAVTALSSDRWTGKGDTIAANGHYLIVGAAYAGAPAGDDKLSQALTDAASLTLEHAGSPVDSVCFYFDTPTLGYLKNLDYPCEGMPVFNPHDDSTGTNVDKSLERKPGGALGNCTDTDDNSSDFAMANPATPESSASPPPH